MSFKTLLLFSLFLSFQQSISLSLSLSFSLSAVSFCLSLSFSLSLPSLSVYLSLSISLNLSLSQCHLFLSLTHSLWAVSFCLSLIQSLSLFLFLSLSLSPSVCLSVSPFPLFAPVSGPRGQAHSHSYLSVRSAEPARVSEAAKSCLCALPYSTTITVQINRAHRGTWLISVPLKASRTQEGSCKTSRAQIVNCLLKQENEGTIFGVVVFILYVIWRFSHA